MSLPFGRYQLLRKIASGGMGQVFLARSAGLQGFSKLLVIKRVLPHLVEDNEFLTMFLDEARIAAGLNHPNLVQIFELGEANGSTYLAMEYVPGEDLRRVERRARRDEPEGESNGGALPLGVTLRIIADAAAGLHYAHEARDARGQPLQLVHRDVSPQNILVGFSGAVKLIDFGVAKAAGRAQHTASGILKGKFPYLSPEQAAGAAIDHRSDQFALGIVLWEILTGQRLFKADSDLATLRRVQDCHVPLPSSLDPKIPPELDAIVLKALARNRDDRYPDCGAFRLALEELAIQKSLPASAAHLAAFMGQLYAKRIAEESNPDALDELTASEPLDDVPTPTRGPTQAGRERTVSQRPASANAADAGPHTLSAAPPRRTSPGKGLAIGLAALFAIGGVGALVAVRAHAEGEPAAAQTAAAQSSTAEARPRADQGPHVIEASAPLPVLAPTPAPTSLTLTSQPSGATVEIDGVIRGRTPLALELAPDAKLAATLTLSGYEPAHASLGAEDAPSLTVPLERKRAKVHRPSPAPALRIKTGR